MNVTLIGKDMEYYIQCGGAAKAADIKAAFEKLGYDVETWLFTTGVYYTLNGKIVNTNIGSNEYKLVLNNSDYKELPVGAMFKVHDWVVDGDTVAIIYDLQKNGYVGHDINRKDFVCKYSDEDMLHLWTIADAKDGDVLVDEYTNTIGIFEKIYGTCWHSKIYCGNSTWGAVYHNGGSHAIKFTKPATKEQRDLLFAKMREAGYQWDAEKKELKEIPKHYDISNFQPFDKVLVRDHNTKTWEVGWYGRYIDDTVCSIKIRYFVVGTRYCRQCIPFNEKTKHLLGTTDMPSEEYINW